MLLKKEGISLNPDRDGVWEEFDAHAFDEETQQWSLVWLDNRNSPYFRPLVGKFDDGLGPFYQVIEAPDGKKLHMRFTSDKITADSARWQQAFSFDGGETWDMN